jgi:hypothetical protein
MELSPRQRTALASVGDTTTAAQNFDGGNPSPLYLSGYAPTGSTAGSKDSYGSKSHPSTVPAARV